MLAWFLTQLRPQAPGLWLLLSMLSLVVLLLLWGSLTERGRRLALLSRWLLIPYLGLISGGLSPRLMGLSAIDWQASFSLGAGILFFVLAALILVRASTVFSTPATQETGALRRPERVSLTPYLGILFLSGGEELHWAFLRGALWELLLLMPTPPPNSAYVAVWLATLLGALELTSLQTAGRGRLFKLVILLASTILFFFTRNFWLCWVLHTTAWVILLPAEKKPISPSSVFN